MNSEIKGAWKHRELRILVVGEGVSIGPLGLTWPMAKLSVAITVSTLPAK